MTTVIESPPKPGEVVRVRSRRYLVEDVEPAPTPANFTEWAQQRNVEAGVLIRNRHFAGQLLQQFEGLIQSKYVRQLPGF